MINCINFVFNYFSYIQPKNYSKKTINKKLQKFIKCQKISNYV